MCWDATLPSNTDWREETANKQTDLKLNKHGDYINDQTTYELPVVGGQG